jgi:flavin-binding protein dodecin
MMEAHLRELPPANRKSRKGAGMSVAKIIEVSAESKKGFEDAIQEGIKRAGTTVENIRGAWIQEQQVVVEKGIVVSYRVNMKVTFVLSE